jgi:hypothetical protein
MAGLEDLGAGLELSWRGGAGPYLLQKKANVNDLAWQNVLTTPANYITVAKDTQTAFYRVMDQPQGIVIPLTVTLSGANEVPAVATAATGLGTLTLEGAQLTYRVAYSGLSGPATAAHIHGPAPATAGAGVLFGLSGAAGTAGVLAGTQTVTPDQFVALVTGQTYVNIHTTTFGGGEVRGQVMPLRIPVALSGGAEIPAVATSGAGSGVLTMIGNKMFYDIDFGGLPTPATAAHLHGPADATAGASPLFGMSGAAGTAGTLKGLQTLTPEQVAMLLAGNTYVNVHTSAHPGGELRGQAIPLQFSAFATGAAELPAVDTPATASGVMTLVGNQFSYNVTYSGLSANATAAHIHGPADVTQSAGVLFGLTGASGTAGVLAGVATLTPDQVVTLMTGKAYVNIHTTAHGGGEVRGQVRLRQ